MAAKEEIIKRASDVLRKLYQDYEGKGLLSIYLWGSIITPDFSPDTSDVDTVGILDDKADFKELDKIRDWLPEKDPSLKRLQINFFFLSELEGGPTRSRLGRLYDAEQAVFDFPYWLYVCGKRYTQNDFPKISPQRVLQHQLGVVETRTDWAINPDKHFGAIGFEYFCKSLAWLCYNIHKLTAPPGPFSWKGLRSDANTDTRILVKKLLELKDEKWDEEVIKSELTFLLQQADELIQKYG